MLEEAKWLRSSSINATRQKVVKHSFELEKIALSYGSQVRISTCDDRKRRSFDVKLK
jgi:hypothetical protein